MVVPHNRFHISFLFLFIFILLSHSNCQTVFYSCSWQNPSTGDAYSLTPLMNNNTDYFLAVTGTSSWNVWINVCRQLVSLLCGANVAACQQWDPSTPAGKASLGAASSVQWVPLVRTTTAGQKGATAKFSAGTGGRSFEIDFQCDEKAGLGSPEFEVETPSKFYNFKWASQYACPTNRPAGPSISGGFIFLLIVLFCMIAYIVGGIIFNKVKRQAHGLELIPNFEFWTSLPGLVKDGVMFIVNSVRGRGYSPIK